MPRNIVQPTIKPDGREEHPAWALIGASRVSGTGAVLFDSDIKHNHYVVVTLGTASRRRELSRDWLHREKEFIEVAMSEAQWASFVSSMNGQGVPCTVLRREGDWQVPGMPYEPRLQESMAEVREAADTMMAAVREAFDTYADHKTVGNLRTLEAAIRNASSNMAFVANSLNEYSENVVQRARADIDAMVVHKAQQLGIDPAEFGTAELTTGES